MVNIAMDGRKVIYSDVDEITPENIAEVLRKAMFVHLQNSIQIDFLYKTYRGKQNILKRDKKVRPEINNRITENRANEIVSFKSGYLIGEPIQYVNHGEDEKVSKDITALNEYMFLEDKAYKDKQLADWMHICGTSYRIALPRTNPTMDEAPFEIHTLDPRYCFVIYHSGLGNRPLGSVKYIENEDGTVVYSVWTDNWYYELEGGIIVNSFINEENGETYKGVPTYYGQNPITEYPLNDARLGAFEIVLPILDAINEVASNRLDGIEQFVQALMLFCNCDIDEATFTALKELGALKYRSDSSNPADVKILTQELNQMQTQTLVDYMYETVLTICGMPNRNGGSSTSDTGSAVIMRDGWSAAEARAKDTETVFKKSEKQFLKQILRILRDTTDSTLPLSNVEIRFTRRNYENITAKANVLVTMLSNPKIHPKLAFIHCGMFADGELAYAMSKEYHDEQMKLLPTVPTEEDDDDKNNSGDDKNNRGGTVKKKDSGDTP